MVAIEALIYFVIGLLVMIVGHFFIDLIIPVDFAKEIHEGNKAVGWVSAGIYAGLGYIIRSAVISFNITESMDLVQGIIGTLLYAAIGVVTFVMGYFVVDLVNRKFNFNEELKNKNEAAGIMILGIFLGVAFIVSGVIQ